MGTGCGQTRLAIGPARRQAVSLKPLRHRPSSPPGKGVAVNRLFRAPGFANRGGLWKLPDRAVVAELVDALA